MPGDDCARRRTNEHQRPLTFARVLDHPHLAERAAGWGKRGREDLFRAFIDRTDDRHASERRLAEPDETPARKVGGKKAQKREPKKCENYAESGQLERQKIIRPKPHRDEALDRTVDGIDEPPDDVGGRRERTGDDDPGQEPIANASAEPRAFEPDGRAGALRRK